MPTGMVVMMLMSCLCGYWESSCIQDMALLACLCNEALLTVVAHDSRSLSLLPRGG